MCTNLENLSPEKVREAILSDTLDLSLVHPSEIACQLRMSVLKNDADYATAILERAPGILALDNGGGKILWHALENGNKFLAEKLVHAGADLNYRSRNGVTFLHRFMHKYDELAVLMIKRGADINIRDCSKKTVLHVAVEEALLDIVDAIAETDVKYRSETRILGLAALSKYAARLLPSLIKSSDVATQKSRARKALVAYLQLKPTDVSLVRSMIDSALLPNYTESDVIGILKHAVVHKHLVNVVQILLDYVERLNGKSDEVALLLCHAAKHPRSSMASLLIQKGANVHTHTKDYEYPLHVACANGSLQNIHLLLSLGADPTVTNFRRLTPLNCLTTDAFKETHKLIIRHLAIMYSKNLPIHGSDAGKINRYSRMRRYYEECVNELYDMKNTRIYEDTTFFCFFDKTVEELSDLVRHVDFMRTYYLNQKEGSVSFSHFSMHVHNVCKMAIDRKNILIARAKVFEQAVMDAPPYDNIVSYMAHDMPELQNFDRMFYFQLHERINDEQDLAYHMNLLC